MLIAARILASCPADEPEQLRALKAAGFDARQALRFAIFLPMAFARPILEEFGVTEISPTVSAELTDGRQLAVRLDRQPEYVAGLALAREHRRTGCIPVEIFAAVAESSAELDALSNALNAGTDIQGSAFSTALVGIHHRGDFIA